MTIYNEAPALLDVKAVAALFQFSPAIIWRRVNDGTMPHPVRIGGMTRWARDEIDAVIDRAKARRSAELKGAVARTMGAKLKHEKPSLVTDEIVREHREFLAMVSGKVRI
jgi:predicted DNA-binding transcriptional regulator AlpA